MFGLGRREMIIFAIVILAVIFGTGYRLAHMQSALDEETSFVVSEKGEKSGPAAAGDSKETAEGEAEKIIVHVTGAVKKPGVYSLPAGSRVIDALNLAVPAADADLEQLNLAVETDDGEQIAVPRKGEAVAGYSSGNSTGSTGKRPTTGGAAKSSGSAAVKIGSGKININKAGVEELDTLPGIGPALAERIVEYRENQGKFKDVSELKNVSGIGDKKFEGLADFVTVK
ncbi:MAG: helix-hairpin-helix domain-containing protein [Bacillota bacterium]